MITISSPKRGKRENGIAISHTITAQRRVEDPAREREKGENRKPYEALTYKICENPTFRFVFVQFQSYRGSAVSESGEVYSVEPRRVRSRAWWTNGMQGSATTEGKG